MKTSFDPQFLVWYSYPELFIKYADTIYYFQWNELVIIQSSHKWFPARKIQHEKIPLRVRTNDIILYNMRKK